MAESGRTSPRNELLSCKERSDDSSELRGAGDVGRDSILTMADAALPLPRRSMPRRFRSAHGFMSVYDVKPVCAIRCRIGSKAGCLIPTDIARLPCTGVHDGDVPALRRSAKSFTMESRRSGSCKSTPCVDLEGSGSPGRLKFAGISPLPCAGPAVRNHQLQNPRFDPWRFRG